MRWGIIFSLVVMLGGCASVDAYRVGSGKLPGADIHVSFTDRNWERTFENKMSYECKTEACGKGSQLLVAMLPSPIGERQRIASGKVDDAYLHNVADKIAQNQNLTKKYVKRFIRKQYVGFDIMMKTNSFAASHNFMLVRAVYNNNSWLRISSRARTAALAAKNAETFMNSVSFTSTGS